MHDIDSTRLEASPDQNEFQESQDFESQNGQGEDSFEMLMTEAEEEELAAELLGVSSEMEMDQFLGGLFRKIKSGLGGAAKFLAQNSGPLAAALKGIGAKALPFLGGALGTAIPIPGLGTALGAAVGKAASNLLQSELENLEIEDQELEMAKRYVRLASQAVRHAAQIPRRRNPYATANFALRNALQRMRGTGSFRPQPVYYRNRPWASYQQPEPCPPCPACPTCAQALPSVDSPPPADTRAPEGNQGPISAGPGADAGTGTGATGEFGLEDTGELDTGELDTGELDTGELQEAGQGEGEGEQYENDNEPLAASGTYGRRAGRWVRRGRKIILYGL